MGTDFNKLRLKYHGDREKMSEILQMECRSKCDKKLPDTLSHAGFMFPSLALAEMSTSDAVADIHASLIDKDDSVLDMTAGLGIDTFHFAQKGCHVTAIELSHEAVTALEHNAKVLELQDRVEVIESDSIYWLQANEDIGFDTIFIDPARRDSSGRHVTLSQCSPDVTHYLPLLLRHARNVIIKMSPMIDIAAAKKELGIDYCEIIVIGTTKECKEVMFRIGDDSSKMKKDTLRCITVGNGEYIPSGLNDRQYSLPEIGGCLLLPYPAVMKGCGGLVDSFKKLHPSTHIYYGEEYAYDFPGQNFRILDIVPFNKREIKSLKSRYPKLNVVARNFPLSAPELVKRLEIKEGGEKTLFAVTIHDGSKILIITESAKNQ